MDVPPAYVLHSVTTPDVGTYTGLLLLPLAVPLLKLTKIPVSLGRVLVKFAVVLAPFIICAPVAAENIAICPSECSVVVLTFALFPN